jgi:hypothetical protein
MIEGRTLKDTQDVTRITVDFSKWLDAGEVIGAVTSATVTVLLSASWNTDVFVAQAPLPIVDTTPLVVLSEALVSNNTEVRLMLGLGTPGVSYVVTFVATGQTSGRQKEVDIIVTIREPQAMPGPTPPPAIIAYELASFTVVAGTQLYLCDSLAGAMTATLPLNPLAGDYYTIKDAGGHAAASPITVLGNGHQIEGGTQVLISVNYGFVNLLYTGTRWVQVGAPLNLVNLLSVIETADFSVAGFAAVYLCDTTGGPLTATLPANPTINAAYTIKDSGGQAATNAITIAGNGFAIEGAVTMIVNTPYGWANLMFTGSQWVQVG